MNPPGGRRQVPLNQDFFVGFGKTVLKPEEVVVSVFIPFSRKVKMDFSCSADGDDGGLENKRYQDGRRPPTSALTCLLLQGEVVRAFRHAPRKESSFATVTTGMRVFFSEGSRVVQDVSIYYGGMGATTVSAAKTCSVIKTRWAGLAHQEGLWSGFELTPMSSGPGTMRP